MLKKCYFEPCLLQVLSTFCVLISIINRTGYATDLILWQILQFLQAIYAKIVESIQARRIRAKLSIANQRPERKKSRKCQEIRAARNLAGCEIFVACKIFAGCTIHSAKFSSCTLFMPLHTVHFSHTIPAARLKFCFLFLFIYFFPFCPCKS